MLSGAVWRSGPHSDKKISQSNLEADRCVRMRFEPSHTERASRSRPTVFTSTSKRSNFAAVSIVVDHPPASISSSPTRAFLIPSSLLPLSSTASALCSHVTTGGAILSGYYVDNLNRISASACGVTGRLTDGLAVAETLSFEAIASDDVVLYI